MPPDCWCTMKRYTMTEGAKTTANGTVVSASSHGTIEGARIALEGDQIFCGACHSPGHIMCVGPRLNELWNGKQVALDNDLCICGCTPHPRLIANQTMRYQWVGAATADEHAQSPAAAAAAVASAAPWTTVADSYDLHFHVLDEITQLPLPDWPYMIEVAGACKLEGRTDKNGKTGKVSAMNADDAILHVYEPDSPPINPNWDR